jgi:hypothetical protein
MGNWNPTETHLIASMVCISSIPDIDGKPISLIKSKRGNSSTVEQLLTDLEKQNRFLRSTACVPSIYDLDDAIVSPTTLEPTLIQTHNVDGNLAIDVLAGSVSIISAKRPNGLFLKEGSSYRHQGDTLARLDCPDSLKSEPIQSFLTPSNWSADVAPQLDGYREAFCRTGGQTREPTAGEPGLIINIGIGPFGSPQDSRGRETDSPSEEFSR